MTEDTLGSPIYTGVVTPGAYTTSANLLNGTSNDVVGKGMLTVVAKGSAAGINITLLVSGQSIANDRQVVFIGTSGTASVRDNILVQQLVAGGRVEVYARNTTATAGTTCDVFVYFKPMK